MSRIEDAACTRAGVRVRVRVRARDYEAAASTLMEHGAVSEMLKARRTKKRARGLIRAR